MRLLEEAGSDLAHSRGEQDRRRARHPCRPARRCSATAWATTPCARCPARWWRCPSCLAAPPARSTSRACATPGAARRPAWSCHRRQVPAIGPITIRRTSADLPVFDEDVIPASTPAMPGRGCRCRATYAARSWIWRSSCRPRRWRRVDRPGGPAWQRCSRGGTPGGTPSPSPGPLCPAGHIRRTARFVIMAWVSLQRHPGHDHERGRGFPASSTLRGSTLGARSRAGGQEAGPAGPAEPDGLDEFRELGRPSRNPGRARPASTRPVSSGR